MARPRILRVLTRAEERIVRSAIARGATDQEAIRAAGITPHRMYAARERELRDLPRQKRGPRRGRRYVRRTFDEIPPDEIARRAAQIRAGWSEEVRLERFHSGFSGPIPD